MAAALARAKVKDSVASDAMTELLAEAEGLEEELADLIGLDTCAYEAVAEAMAMPGDTRPQRRERNRVMQAALKEAAQVPLQIGEVAVEVARLSLLLTEWANMTAVSDAGVAVILADAAAQSAALDVKTKMVWIEDQDFKRDVLGRDRICALRDRLRARCGPGPDPQQNLGGIRSARGRLRRNFRPRIGIPLSALGPNYLFSICGSAGKHLDGEMLASTKEFQRDVKAKNGRFVSLQGQRACRMPPLS